MQNVVYSQLKEYLQKAITSQFLASDLVVNRAIVDHMDALVDSNTSAASVGHLFVSRFVQECPTLNQACSPGLQALGREAFKWAMHAQEWTTAAWLLSCSGLSIPLPQPLHPHPSVMHALICNDSMEWPALYTACLKDGGFMACVFACDAMVSPCEEDALSQTTRVYFNQIRKCCYTGPGSGLLAVNMATRWLALHHDDSPESALLPKTLRLRHIHPEQEKLDSLLRNQWRVTQFWSTGDTVYLDGLEGIEADNFQVWFCLLSAQGYHKFSDTAPKILVWNHWWASHQPSILAHTNFWLNLHVQMQGLDPASLRKDERYLAVKAALALACRRPDGHCALPEEYPETQSVGA